MQLTYHGHSAFEIDRGGTKILLDPWIAGNPHTERSPEGFTDVSTVMVTHGAFDHLGDAPGIAKRNGATLVCDRATRTVLEDRGFPEDLLEDYIFGAEHHADGWSAKVVEARHQSAPADGRVIGPALAYVLRIDGERIYHMGDTSIFGDLELFGELYDPTVTLIPVGQAEGRLTELHPDEAALVAEWLPSDLFVPMHYVPGSDNPREFAEHAAERGVTKRSEIRPLEPGTSIDL